MAARQWTRMDLQTRDRAAADVEALPAGQSDLPLAGDERGSSPRGPAEHGRARLAGWLRGPVVLLLTAGATLYIARESGVSGKGAAPALAEIGLGAIGVFAVSGFGVTRLLLPAGLSRYELLWVVPVGACVSGLGLTALGLAPVPLE